MSLIVICATFTLMSVAISSVLFIYGRRWASRFSAGGAATGQGHNKSSAAPTSLSGNKSPAVASTGKLSNKQQSPVSMRPSNSLTNSNNNNLSKQSSTAKQVHFAQVISTPNLDSGKQARSNGLASKSQVAEVNNNNSQLKQLTPAVSAEPAMDELDAAILPEVFNPTKTGVLAATKHRQTRSVVNTATPVKRGRHAPDTKPEASGPMTSKNLLQLLATSSLSQEEVELSIETLLNKLDSGDTEWQAPRSDPLQKLKNQLRDSELALAKETQNHEQARARVAELKQQLQSERSVKSSASEQVAQLHEELDQLRKELERTKDEVVKQRKNNISRGSVISELEQENAQLKVLIAAKSNSRDLNEETLGKLRRELEDKTNQLHHYDTLTESLRESLETTEASLRRAEAQLAHTNECKQHDHYEACAKIAELEQQRRAMEMALEERVVRLEEVSSVNKQLGSSLAEMRQTAIQQDNLIKRLHEERQMNELAMKRTLSEMETELKQLHEQLSLRQQSQPSDEQQRYKKELSDVGLREQRLKRSMKQLREGLGELFPDLKRAKQASPVEANSDDWVQRYLVALRQLTATVNELRNSKPKSGANCESLSSQLSVATTNSHSSKRSNLVDKSTLTLRSNGRLSPRVGSPTSLNGRSSRGSNSSGGGDHDKRLMETKLVENMALFCLRCLD